LAFPAAARLAALIRNLKCQEAKSGFCASARDFTLYVTVKLMNMAPVRTKQGPAMPGLALLGAEIEDRNISPAKNS
jgi:hypothetical protein